MHGLLVADRSGQIHCWSAVWCSSCRHRRISWWETGGRTLRTDHDLSNLSTADNLLQFIICRCERLCRICLLGQIQPRKHATKSCRLYGFHPASRARFYRSYRSYKCVYILSEIIQTSKCPSSPKYLDHGSRKRWCVRCFKTFKE